MTTPHPEDPAEGPDRSPENGEDAPGDETDPSAGESPATGPAPTEPPD